MRYFLAIMAFFGLLFAACRQNAEVVCDTKEVIAYSGDTYWSIAVTHCSNPQEAVFRLIDINKYPSGGIPTGAVIVLP
jgi:hypothetical protein